MITNLFLTGMTTYGYGQHAVDWILLSAVLVFAVSALRSK